MRISVIIPSFGQAQYLEEAITSVLQQSFKDYDLIVIDDGSDDGSLEIAKSYGGKLTLVSQINKGLASARNAGIMNTSSYAEYIMFLDADDKMDFDCLEKIDKIAEETLADVITPSLHCFNEETGMVVNTILMGNPTFNDFKEGNRLAYCSAIKRSVLLEVGGYSPRYDVLGGWEDLALWYDLMRRGKKIITIQEPLVWYRIKENSMWKEAEKNSKALWEQIVKDFPEAKEHAKD